MIKYPKLEKLKYTNSGNFFLIAGPCVIENHESAYEIAANLVILSNKWHIPLIFKASFMKANRTSIKSFTGITKKVALQNIHDIGGYFNIPTITDVHSVEDVKLASKYVDVLQIPAFLCRQTELIVAAAKTGLPVNIKKGQFMSPETMSFAVNKIRSTRNKNSMITERGAMFGYNDLIVDFRGIPIMKKNGCPVIMDCTHSLQKPNSPNGVTGGNPEHIELMAKLGIVAGCDGLFIETHPNPRDAKSDSMSMLDIQFLEKLVIDCLKIQKAL